MMGRAEEDFFAGAGNPEGETIASVSPCACTMDGATPVAPRRVVVCPRAGAAALGRVLVGRWAAGPGRPGEREALAATRAALGVREEGRGAVGVRALGRDTPGVWPADTGS